jgi:dihydrofolate reductase
LAQLIYSAITSLDGYTEDTSGNFRWAAPDDEVHSFVNDLERPIGTHLYGRRMYETMRFWETADDPEPVMTDYAEIWRAADKIVYSTTLDDPGLARTRVERDFDPEAVRELKSAATAPISIGGPTLAATAIRAGLVDEYQQFIAPVIVGGGKHFLPKEVRVDLELLDERRFAGGFTYLRYRPISGP